MIVRQRAERASCKVPSNNPLQRSGHDKVHAPNFCAGIWVSGCAPKVRRAAAEQGR